MIQSAKFAAGVFIGGMEGVEQEYELFVRAHPKALALPVATGRGAQEAHLVTKIGARLADREMHAQVDALGQ